MENHRLRMDKVVKMEVRRLEEATILIRCHSYYCETQIPR